LEYLLGMDAGGTKTLCALTDINGRVVGVGRAGCGNFQASGRQAAGKQLALSIDRAVEVARIRQDQIAVAFYGISGADREKDFRIVRDLLPPMNPASRMFLENDTFIALRAGAPEGVGLGLISGTGTNAIGFNQKGERMQVGGWGSPYLGDFGSAHDIAAEAIARAQRGRDGRGPPTLLYDTLVAALGVEDLVDISERNYFDSHTPLDVGSLAPLVFETAREGDTVALEILRKAGREISLAALSVLRSLFLPDAEIPVVLGGSVFQRGTHGAMVSALEDAIRKEFPKVEFKILDQEPVLGAILGAADQYFDRAIPSHFKETLCSCMREIRPGSTVWT